MIRCFLSSALIILHFIGLCSVITMVHYTVCNCLGQPWRWVQKASRPANISPALPILTKSARFPPIRNWLGGKGMKQNRVGRAYRSKSLLCLLSGLIPEASHVVTSILLPGSLARFYQLLSSSGKVKTMLLRFFHLCTVGNRTQSGKGWVFMGWSKWSQVVSSVCACVCMYSSCVRVCTCVHVHVWSMPPDTVHLHSGKYTIIYLGVEEYSCTLNL